MLKQQQEMAADSNIPRCPIHHTYYSTMNNPSSCYGTIREDKEVHGIVTGTDGPLRNKHGMSARHKQILGNYELNTQIIVL